VIEGDWEKRFEAAVGVIVTKYLECDPNAYAHCVR
jgi:hypothetical protein